jgi:uncharacterized protein YndB with AHSA1/START domain
MREVRHTTKIDAPPERVWDWLSHLTDHYTEWHPDHVSAGWVYGPPNQAGSVLKAVEVMGGHFEDHEFEVVSIDPPHEMAYRILGPVGTLLPGGAFRIRACNGGSEFTATISYRFGPLAERLYRQRIEALRVHMSEEGERLSQLIGGGVEAGS